MVVEDILWKIPVGTVVNIEQMPICGLGGRSTPVHRQKGEVRMLLNSNQNYLDFEVKRIYQKTGLLTICCKANKEQELRTLSSWYEY